MGRGARQREGLLPTVFIAVSAARSVSLALHSQGASDLDAELKFGNSVTYRRLWLLGSSLQRGWGADARERERPLGALRVPVVAESHFRALIYIWTSAAGLTDDS